MDPQIIKPSLANKKPTDLGVLGLVHTKAALDSKFGPPVAPTVVLSAKDSDDFTSSSWGKESPEEIERKAKFVRERRVRQMDQWAMVRYLASVAIKAFLLQKFVSGAAAQVLGNKQAKVLGIVMVALGFAHKYGAKPIINKGRGVLPQLPIIGGLISLTLHKHEFHDYLLQNMRAVNFQTGEMTIPGARFISVMDARDREWVLKTNFRNYLKNREDDMGSFEYVLGDVIGRGIFATDKLEWQDSRKIASHMFSGASLKAKMEDVFNHHADTVVQLLEARAGTGKSIDMQEVFQCAIFDAFCEIAFGYYPNATAAVFEGTKPPFLVAFDHCQSVATERFLMPPAIWHLQRLFGSLTGLGQDGEFARSSKVLDDYVYPIIEDRLKDVDLDAKSDLLSLYIRHARETNQPHMLAPTYLRDTIINFMIAGRDTTSCTLAYTMKFVGENPDIEQRLLNEALLPLASKNEKVTWDDSRNYPFADATFNEVLRMAPPVGDDMRICVGDDTWPSGIKATDGTRVLISNISIGRDPFLWSNPETFNPERWMSYDENGVPAHVKRMDEFVYPVFFSGRRLCLGKDMARFESIVFMTKLLTKLRVIPESCPDPTMSTGPVIFMRGGNLCRIERR